MIAVKSARTMAHDSKLLLECSIPNMTTSFTAAMELAFQKKKDIHRDRAVDQQKLIAVLDYYKQRCVFCTHMDNTAAINGTHEPKDCPVLNSIHSHEAGYRAQQGAYNLRNRLKYRGGTVAICFVCKLPQFDDDFHPTMTTGMVHPYPYIAQSITFLIWIKPELQQSAMEELCPGAAPETLQLYTKWQCEFETSKIVKDQVSNIVALLMWWGSRLGKATILV